MDTAAEIEAPFGLPVQAGQEIEFGVHAISEHESGNPVAVVSDMGIEIALFKVEIQPDIIKILVWLVTGLDSRTNRELPAIGIEDGLTGGGIDLADLADTVFAGLQPTGSEPG